MPVDTMRNREVSKRWIPAQSEAIASRSTIKITIQDAQILPLTLVEEVASRFPTRTAGQCGVSSTVTLSKQLVFSFVVASFEGSALLFPRQV